MYLSGTKCMALSLGCILSLSAIAKNAVPSIGQGVQKPLCFIENKGQFTDNNGHILTDIQYRMSAPGVDMYVGNGKLHYQFSKVTGDGLHTPDVTSYGVEVTLLGANPHAQVLSADEQDYYEQYYTAGANGIVAHSWNKVVYKDVYPGIDWVLYVKGGTVEYDFVVRPGADANLIKLQYDGATALNVAADGGIIAQTPMGTIREKKPFAYDKSGKEVASAFRVHDNVVSFATGKHDGTLTIDPSILWSTYFGGANEDVATCVTLSAAGNVYIAGYTTSTGLGTVGGTYGSALGGYDAFLTRYSNLGVRQFTTYYGGTGNDRANGVAVDGVGIYLVGQTTGSAGMATFGAYRGANSGLSDGFLIRFNAGGGVTWGTYYGGTGNDVVNGVAVDNVNGVYITGRTESATLIASAGVYQTALSGSADAFIAKFNVGSGAVIYSTYYGGTGVDEGASVTTDAAGNVMITGQTTSVVNIASAGAYQTALSGVNDAFIVRLNTTASTRIWGTYFGGSGADEGKSIVCRTATGDVGIVGYTTSTSGIASTNAQQTVYGGGAQDAFVAMFSTTGARTWSSYHGGNNLDFGESICLDPAGNLVIAGGTFSTNGIGTAGSMQPAIGGNYDAFVAKYSRIGQRIWGTYFGDALYDYAFGVTCSTTGEIHLAGHTTSTTGIATPGAQQTAYAGGTYDAFLTKLSIDTFALINQTYVDTLVCAGGTMNLFYTVSPNFRGGNSFTAQLSNAAGSFASPVNIGTLVSSTSGMIVCTIPGGTPAGSGYRIRIVGTAPAYISPDNFKNIQVMAALPAVALTANSPICVTNTLALTSTATWSISSYNWTGPNAFASFAPNPTRAAMTLADAGVYTLTTTHNGCPANVSTINVVVNNVTPVSPVAFASTLNCNGGTLYLFADTSSSAPPATYSWTGPAGFTSTMQHPTVSPLTASSAGIYYVVDTVDGCPSAPTPVNVTVTPNTITGMSISVSPNDTVCSGTLVSFSSIPMNAGVSPTFQWQVNGLPVVGAITNAWATSSLSDGNVITCVMTSNAICPAPANAVSNPIAMNVIESEMMVYIFANPGLSVNPGDSIVFTSAVYNAGTGATYQWQRNSSDIPGATDASYTLHNVTVYDTITLLVASTMPCVSPAIGTSNAMVAHPNTGVAAIAAAIGNVELFPNPNSGTFTIRGEVAASDIQDVSVTIINAVGQVVLRDKADVVNGVISKAVSINNLAPGIYMLQLSSEGGSRTVRFSVQQ